MLPVSQRVQPGVYTLMALSRYRDALVQQVGSERPLVYQPLVPQILTACYQVVLLPPRDFGAWPPVARDVNCAVALFLHVRTAYPDLIQKHRGAGSLLLTPPLDTQATYQALCRTSGLMVTSAMLELMSFSRMGRQPLPPSLHDTCRLSRLICELRSCLTGRIDVAHHHVGLWQMGIHRTGSWA